MRARIRLHEYLKSHPDPINREKFCKKFGLTQNGFTMVLVRQYDYKCIDSFKGVWST